jgi:endonuclease YncB( thermonuclease family)
MIVTVSMCVSRASGNATPELRALEQQARSTRVGIWGGRDENDD